jgi:hypothetical protein
MKGAGYDYLRLGADGDNQVPKDAVVVYELPVSRDGGH